MKTKKIIFICKYNAFRSRVAEKYFNKLNKNKEWKAVSRGFIMGADPDEKQFRIARTLLSVNINFKSKPVDLKELVEADKIVVVAKDIPNAMFDYWLVPLKKKVVRWDIKDEQNKNEKNIKKIVFKIQKRVEKLVEELK
jgi:protein-tyrosine-phosphatase